MLFTQATHTPSSNGTEGNFEHGKFGERRRGSIDTGERIASAIKSPLRSIRRQFHPHHERDPEGQGMLASDTENDASRRIRRYALVNTANRFKMKVHGSKEEIHQVEDVADVGRGSPPTSAGQGAERLEADGTLSPHAVPDIQEVSVPRNSHGTSVHTTARSDVFDIMPIEEEDESYRQKLRYVLSILVEYRLPFSLTPDVLPQYIALC
jgi:hypothetical protein